MLEILIATKFLTMKLTSFIKAVVIIVLILSFAALIVYRDNISSIFSEEQDRSLAGDQKVLEGDTSALPQDTIDPPIPTQSVDVRRNPIKSDQYDPNSK